MNVLWKTCVGALGYQCRLEYISTLTLFRDIRERQMRKANAANSFPKAKGNEALKNAKKLQPRQTIITNVDVENPSAHATKNCTLASSSATNGNFMTTNDICSAVSGMLKYKHQE